MKKITEHMVCAMILAMVVGCAKQAIDLRQLQLKQPLDVNIEGYASKTEQQDGHIEASAAEGFKVVDNGERVVNYAVFEDDVDQFNFSGLALNSQNGVKISVYNNMLAYIAFKFADDQPQDFLSLFEKEFVTPDSVLLDHVMIDQLAADTRESLLKGLPKYCQSRKDDFNNEVIDYPQRMYWVKDDVLYSLTLDPINSHVNAKVDMISRKAFTDKVIVGYHNHVDNPFIN